MASQCIRSERTCCGSPRSICHHSFFAALLASGLSIVAGVVGVEAQDVALVVGPLVAYVGFQGVADVGKGKAELENDRRS